MCVLCINLSLNDLWNADTEIHVKLIFKPNGSTFYLDEITRKFSCQNIIPDCVSYEEDTLDVDNFIDDLNII